MAVATGVADCVVAYRAFNERSGMRFGQVQLRLIQRCGLHKRGQFVLLSARAFHTGRAGRDDRQALHAPVRCDEPRLRRHLGGRPQTYRQQSKAYFYGK